MEPFQPVIDRLVSELGALTLGAAAMLLSAGAGSLAWNAGRSGKMQSAHTASVEESSDAPPAGGGS